MIHKSRFIILGLLIIILSFIFLNQNTCYSSDTNLKNKKVLVLASYDVQNKWEKRIITSLKQNIEKDISIKVDFLDSKSAQSDIYNESFIELLDLKYKKYVIDCILVIDDEALELARENLFNENSFMYKRPIIFVGVNKPVILSPEESKYITGIVEYQDNLLALNTILEASKNINDIYVVLDKSIYSSIIKSDIANLSKLTVRPVNIHIIEDSNFNVIENKIKDTNNNHSAILLCGSYDEVKTGEVVLYEDVIKRIKSNTKAPIYTKIETYVKAGAIGGIVNDGDRLGKMASNMIQNMLYKQNEDMLILGYNNINIPLFNYKELMEYKINPQNLPKNSEYINKGSLDLLLPKNVQVGILFWICLIILFIAMFLYKYIMDRKKSKINDRLLIESLERHEIKTDFILTISHELRTPLNIIINATNLLKLKMDINEFNYEFSDKQLGLISKNANRLLRLINNLIDVSKIEAGHMDTSFRNENIIDVVEDATMSVVDLAKSYNIDIVFDTEEEEIITSIDRFKIERIMLNLLSNSIKFTEEGGHIYVNIRKIDKNIIIEVKDNGIGMSEELQSHLFEKFRRAKLYPSLEREHEGSGLGLFIVKGLVELHKGTINVESYINKGTTFTISIPQVIIDNRNSSQNLMNIPIDYISQIELSDIYDEDKK